MRGRRPRNLNTVELIRELRSAIAEGRVFGSQDRFADAIYAEDEIYPGLHIDDVEDETLRSNLHRLTRPMRPLSHRLPQPSGRKGLFALIPEGVNQSVLIQPRPNPGPRP